VFTTHWMKGWTDPRADQDPVENTILLHLSELKTRFLSRRLSKGKTSPCAYLIKHYAMKTHRRVDVQTHVFSTSALVGGEWSASRLGRFTPGESAPGIQWTEGWMDNRAGLDDMEK
jgi:hypothetical protein